MSTAKRSESRWKLSFPNGETYKLRITKRFATIGGMAITNYEGAVHILNLLVFSPDVDHTITEDADKVLREFFTLGAMTVDSVFESLGLEEAISVGYESSPIKIRLNAELGETGRELVVNPSLSAVALADETSSRRRKSPARVAEVDENQYDEVLFNTPALVLNTRTRMTTITDNFMYAKISPKSDEPPAYLAFNIAQQKILRALYDTDEALTGYELSVMVNRGVSDKDHRIDEIYQPLDQLCEALPWLIRISRDLSTDEEVQTYWLDDDTERLLNK